MAEDMSDRYALPLLNAAQAQKEMTHNEALALIDMLLHAQAESVGLAAPPGTETVGQCWIVAAGASGDWAGQAGALACFTSGGWRFVGPRAGLRVAVAHENSIYVHNGTDWGIDPVHSDGFYVAGERIVGAREAAIADPAGGSTVDAEARATVAQILSMLRTHGLIDPA